jgi:hypothetical protein
MTGKKIKGSLGRTEDELHIGTFSSKLLADDPIQGIEDCKPRNPKG